MLFVDNIFSVILVRTYYTLVGKHNLIKKNRGTVNYE